VIQPNSSQIACTSGTLGALVQDQNANQYLLTAGHVLSTGPTGVVVSGQIVQPGLGDTPFPSGRFGGCFANSNNAIANYTLTVGGVGSKIPPQTLE
jgi:hypothetical protein